MSQEPETYVAEDDKIEKFIKKEWNLTQAVKACQVIITQDNCIHKIQIDNNYVYIVPEELYIEAVSKNTQIISLMKK